MTTWERATAREKQALGLLMDAVKRAGLAMPTLPKSIAGNANGSLSGLTKRDAGTLTSRLRETLEESAPTRGPGGFSGGTGARA